MEIVLKGPKNKQERMANSLNLITCEYRRKNLKNLSQNALLSRSSECIRMDKQIQFCQNNQDW